jgi:hypothetical protein
LGVLKNLLTSEVQEFIRDHQLDDERQLVLKHKSIAGVPSSFIADQIAGRRKAKDKLPTYYNSEGIIYPHGINLEQTSSEQTARFKCALISQLNLPPSRGTVQRQRFGQGVDLTGGFGIDTYFLSQVFHQFHYIEPNTGLLEMACHNHNTLGAVNIEYHNASAEEFLDQLTQQVDFIFIDPSRRSQNKKVFTLSDSEPDIVVLQKKIFSKTDVLLIKASPLLDIKLGLKELDSVKKVWVVSVENEVRELLFLCEKNFSAEPVIEAVNLPRNGSPESFDFLFSEEAMVAVQFADPLIYLYEPNASILKAGAFKMISKQFNLLKLQTNTHLYTSNTLVENFPGRIFKVEALVKPDPKTIKEFFPDKKANVSTRNYPLSVDELKKKTGISDGGDKYLLAFSGVSKKFLCVATRIMA